MKGGFECASVQLKESEACQMKDIEQQNFQVVMFFTLNLQMDLSFEFRDRIPAFRHSKQSF